MIRLATPPDHTAIRDLNVAAFDGAAEADLVKALRTDGDVVLELVAEEAGAIVGHILFSRLWADSEGLYVALAPMAVAPDRQRQGVGGQLVRSGLELCQEFGAHAVVVLGHLDYYPRFGFSPEAASKLKSPYAGSPAYMAKALEPGALDEPRVLAYPDAFGRT